MVGTRVARTFGVKEAFVGAYNSGGAVPTWVEFDIAQDSTLELSYERAEHRDGRGYLEHTWIHSPSGRVTLRGGEYSMRIMEMVSGSPVSSYTSVDSIQFGVNEELTPPAVRLKLVCECKDGSENEGEVLVYAYKAVGQMPSIGMAQTTPGVVEILFDLQRDTKTMTGIPLRLPTGGLTSILANQS